MNTVTARPSPVQPFAQTPAQVLAEAEMEGGRHAAPTGDNWRPFALGWMAGSYRQLWDAYRMLEERLDAARQELDRERFPDRDEEAETKTAAEFAARVRF